MQKDPAEMSEDEIRMGKEFEKKEAAFLEEREKLKKVNHYHSLHVPSLHIRWLLLSMMT